MARIKGLNRLQQLKALEHLGISVFFAILGFVLGKMFMTDLISCIMLAWIIFCLVQMGVSWYTYARATPTQTQQHAAMEDAGRPAMFLVVLLATFGGMLAVFILLAKADNNSNHWLEVILSMAGMFLSWMLVHTIYTSRYAHLYYDKRAGKFQQGLQFPGDEDPDFIDFAYHSLVIGMTFQVSDIDITSREMRRLTLWHSLISFIFNTCIVALTINAVAGLLS